MVVTAHEAHEETSVSNEACKACEQWTCVEKTSLAQAETSMCCFINVSLHNHVSEGMPHCDSSSDASGMLKFILRCSARRLTTSHQSTKPDDTYSRPQHLHKLLWLSAGCYGNISAKQTSHDRMVGSNSGSSAGLPFTGNSHATSHLRS